ncbi:MAG: T9SS type A sorting domain-containing protein [Bacteroidales bacterium]|nr:T9SS type A sorting domain-containing protein [Bacteroidales bacterium]MDY0216885.1 T9SS type A sorting domain-containing protein [Bacteroidales bacterium]
MKKKLHLLLFVLIIGVIKVSAQCTPDPTLNHSGIIPDSATNLPPAYVGTTYSTTLTAKVPLDTVFLGVSATILKICIDQFIEPSITDFSWTTNVSENCFPGGQTNCLIMTANPQTSDIGIHSMQIMLKTSVKVGIVPTTITQKDTIKYFQIVVHPAAGISVGDARNFFALSNVPNPFNQYTDVYFNAPKTEIYSISVYNLLGEAMLVDKINAIQGSNKYTLNAENLPDGIYIYKLTNGIDVFTERMVIQK